MNGIQLVTKVKNNMKNSLMSVADKIMLRKRALVESVNDELKNIAQIEHSRLRSFANFITNTLSAIVTYCFFPRNHLSRWSLRGRSADFVLIAYIGLTLFYLSRKICLITPMLIIPILA